jgi:hypothetical protein
MTGEQLFLRFGAIALIIGSIVVFVCRGLHGDLPAADAAAALAFIAARPIYAVVHLGAVLGIIVWVAGLVALANALPSPAATVLGRLGAALALVGAAVYTVDFSIDGFAGRALAEQWAAAPPAGRADLELSATTAFQMLRGTSLTAITILWGVPLILFGFALMRQGYAPWLGWSGVAVGGVTFFATVAEFLWPDFIPGVWIYGGLVSLVQIWSAVLGVVLWRTRESGRRHENPLRLNGPFQNAATR